MKLRINESNSNELISQLNNLEVAKGYRATTYELIKEYEKLLNLFDVNTIISYKDSAGTNTFVKDSNDFIGWTSVIAPHYNFKESSAFDVASTLASRGNWAKGPIVLGTDIDLDKRREIFNNCSYGNTRFSFIK